MSDDHLDHPAIPHDVVSAARATFGRRAEPTTTARGTAPPVPRSGQAPASTALRTTPVAPATLSAGRLALSYAKACIGAFLMLFLLNTGFSVFGQAVEVSPMRLLVAALFAWVFGIPLLPVVMAGVLLVQLLRVRRGYADVLVGALVGGALVAWQVSATGMLTTWALKLLVAATFGGFAFWRSEGFPGAAPASRAGLASTERGLKRGLWLGARLWR